MAAHIKPSGKGGGAKPAKPKGGKAAKGANRGSNTASSDEIVEAFDQLFDIKRRQKSANSGFSKDMADEYATIASRFEVNKKLVKHLFKKESNRRADAAKEAEFDGTDKDELLKLAQMFGEDSPFGKFAMEAASLASKDALSEPIDPEDGDED